MLKRTQSAKEFLDVKDKKILYELTQNARFSYATIANNVGLQKKRVAYRINNLIKKGVIKGFTTSIYRRAIGLDVHHDICLSLEKVSIEEKNKIIEVFKKHPDIIKIYEGEGNLGLFLTVACIDRFHLKEVYDFIKEQCSHYLIDYALLFKINDSFLGRIYFLENLEIPSSKTTPSDGFHKLLLKHQCDRPKGLIQLDETDLEILQLLRQDARIALGTIATKLKLSLNTVKYRITKMIKTGLMYSFTLLLDHSALGFQKYFLFLRLQGEREAKEKLLNQIGQDKCAYYRANYVGTWDHMFLFYVKNPAYMKNFLSKLYAQHSNVIAKNELFWVTKDHKYISFQENIKEIYKRAKQEDRS